MIQNCLNEEVWQEVSSRLVRQLETWASSYSSGEQDGRAAKMVIQLETSGAHFEVTTVEV